MSTSVAVSDVTVELGGARILDGVDLTVEAGGWVSIVGPNGAGKTTLMRVLSGGLSSQVGQVLLDGEDLRRLSSRRRAQAVALVPQAPVVPEGIRVLDYALLGRTPHVPFFGSESMHDVEVVHATLERLGVDPRAARTLESCSGG